VLPETDLALSQSCCRGLALSTRLPVAAVWNSSRDIRVDKTIALQLIEFPARQSFWVGLVSVFLRCASQYLPCMFTAALSHESNGFSIKQHYARQESAARINGKPFKLRHEFYVPNGLIQLKNFKIWKVKYFVIKLK
jgi:hypothetical protein